MRATRAAGTGAGRKGGVREAVKGVREEGGRSGDRRGDGEG